MNKLQEIIHKIKNLEKELLKKFQNKETDYFVINRQSLSYLNPIEKLNYFTAAEQGLHEMYFFEKNNWFEFSPEVIQGRKPEAA